MANRQPATPGGSRWKQLPEPSATAGKDHLSSGRVGGSSRGCLSAVWRDGRDRARGLGNFTLLGLFNDHVVILEDGSLGCIHLELGQSVGSERCYFSLPRIGQINLAQDDIVGSGGAQLVLFLLGFDDLFFQIASLYCGNVARPRLG